MSFSILCIISYLQEICFCFYALHLLNHYLIYGVPFLIFSYNAYLRILLHLHSLFHCRFIDFFYSSLHTLYFRSFTASHLNFNYHPIQHIFQSYFSGPFRIHHLHLPNRKQALRFILEANQLKMIRSFYEYIRQNLSCLTLKKITFNKSLQLIVFFRIYTISSIITLKFCPDDSFFTTSSIK